ncbi:nucleoside-diphosphate sugar epimerase/dehydratase [Altererythrobacter sp.]|nr:nucleoside-diphosphate sugar epimerase/dehydratase [Altererythrobacter sp.]
MLIALGIVLATWLPVFLLCGIYRSVVRFVGARTMTAIATGCAILAVVWTLAFSLNPIPGIPRTVGVISAIIFAAFVFSSRLVARYFLFDLVNQRQFGGSLKRVLIYGAGHEAQQLGLSLRHDPSMVLEAYLAGDNLLTGQRLDGIPIIGDSSLADVIETRKIDIVLLAVPELSRKSRLAIVERLKAFNVHVMTLPAVSEFISGNVTVADLREIDIGDLLGRDAVPPDAVLLGETVTGKSVMVTGAGGSIGSELCRQIVKLRPFRIHLVEVTEHALYVIETELKELQNAGKIEPGMEIHAELINVTEAASVRRMFERCRPETVFHTAAYKHVPLVEENVLSGMRNNIFGTLNCALEAERSEVACFILVSTDKAVRPTNVMGATKRVSELVLQGLAARGSKTKYGMVRFGNVLGSSGSVVPRFQRQIRDGGPVTLTHRDVTRYFMTIPEAAQLVIQASSMAQGGEVFVLDMGKPIRIFDLARTMISLSGLTVQDSRNPDGDIAIVEVGLRKGEKLFEELLIGNNPQKTPHKQIMQAREEFLPWPELAAIIEELDSVLKNGARHQALVILSDLVPEYVGEQSVRMAKAVPD